MRSVDLKEQIRQVLNVEWAGFAERHPRLAEAIDQQLLIEQCQQRLWEDPQYAEAMAQVQTHGLAIGALQDVLRDVVRGLLRAL